MQFLVMSRRRSEDFPQEEFDRLFADEASRAREFYAAGFTRHIWHRVDGGGVCQVVEARDEAEVRDTLAPLPFAKRGMLDIDVVALKPYAGFTG